MQVGFGKLILPKTGALVLGVLEKNKLLNIGLGVDANCGNLLTSAMKGSRFTGKPHQTLTVVFLL